LSKCYHVFLKTFCIWWPFITALLILPTWFSYNYLDRRVSSQTENKDSLILPRLTLHYIEYRGWRHSIWYDRKKKKVCTGAINLKKSTPAVAIVRRSIPVAHLYNWECTSEKKARPLGVVVLGGRNVSERPCTLGNSMSRCQHYPLFLWETATLPQINLSRYLCTELHVVANEKYFGFFLSRIFWPTLHGTEGNICLKEASYFNSLLVVHLSFFCLGQIVVWLSPLFSFFSSQTTLHHGKYSLVTDAIEAVEKKDVLQRRGGLQRQLA
jgi:hypothetical protein